MKYIVLSLLLVTTMLFLTSCLAFVMTPALGIIHTDVKSPGLATSSGSYSKVGTASCSSIIGLFATGDASIETAAKNGGITKIHHIDVHSKNILGIIATYTVYVYGE